MLLRDLHTRVTEQNRDSFKTMRMSLCELATLNFQLLSRFVHCDLVRARELLRFHVLERIKKTPLPVSDGCLRFPVPCPKPIPLPHFWNQRLGILLVAPQRS